MATSKDIKKLIRRIQTWQGWRVEERSKGWMVYPPDKTKPAITIHRTPSDHRAWRNMISQLRRAGAPI